MPELTDVASAWLAEGEAVATVAGGRAMLLVAGADTAAAALVALGLARTQSRARRVSVVDLTGGAPPLRELVPDDDPHGIVDVLLHGVSLARVSRRVDEEGQLSVVPTGSQAVDEYVYRHDRWRRLRSLFQQNGQLLLLVAPASAGLVDSLAAPSDGVVAVGRTPSLKHLPNLLVTVAREDAPADAGEASAGRPVTPAAPDAPAPVRAEASPGDAAPARPVRRTLPDGQRAEVPAPQPEGGRGGQRLVLLAVLGVLVLVAIAWFLTRRRDANETSAAMTPAAAGSTAREAAGTVDTTGTVVDFRDRVAVANPQDSARATSFAVELVSATSDSIAWRFLVSSRIALPASTVSPVTVSPDGGRWHRVIAGAFETSSRADSLLRAARAAGILEADAGRVIRAPIALRVADGLGTAAATSRVRALRQQGIGAYALRQEDGRVHVYVGAFETPQQAQYLVSRLRDAGVETTIAYRTGRLF